MAYENARACLYYGFSRKHWRVYGLSKEEADKIWREAFRDMANNL